MTSKTATTRLICLLLLSAGGVTPATAAAQGAPSGGDGTSEGAPAGGTGPSIVVVPGPTAPSYPGSLPPANFNPDAHLPSSSRTTTDASRSADGFDFQAKAGGPASVRGATNGQYLSEGTFTPEAHAVRRGDTLWEISGRYFQNPYQWPRLWALNPQIQNPHWIYPGDQVRLRDQTVAASALRLGLGNRRGVPAGTVFLREMGWVDDRDDDTWGELVGSTSDRMMLTDGDDIYVQLGEQHDVKLGDELTVFRPIRTVDHAKGQLVSIRGTARIDRYNPKTHMARARIIESIDVIERGAKIGPVGRKFDVVPPVPSDRDLDAAILAAVFPYHFYGQNQVVFIDRGEADGVKPGMRFFAVFRGDRWQQNIRSAGKMGVLRPRVEDDRPARVDPLPTGIVDDDDLPDETIAELRVMRVREHTSAAIVVDSKHEVERNVRLYARKGF